MPNETILSLPFITRKMLDFEQGTVFQVQIELVTTIGNPITFSGYTKAGAFSFSMNHTGSGLIEKFTFALPDMPIALTTTADSLSGITDLAWGQMFLMVNGSRIQKLASGYFGQANALSWPNGRTETPLDGKGQQQGFSGANPAAGNEMNEVPASGTIMKLQNIGFTFVTDATVANRRVRLSLVDPGGNVILIPSPAVQPASQTYNYYFGVNLPSLDLSSIGVQFAPLPDGLFWNNQCAINTDTVLLKAGDDYASPHISFIKYIDPTT